MHHAVRGVRPYPENGSGGGGGEAQDNSSSADPCSYALCPEIEPGKGFVCSGEFVIACDTDLNSYDCCEFTCDPGLQGQFWCQRIFGCKASFICTSFDPEDECGSFYPCIPF
jgi:hypothetical protein